MTMIPCQIFACAIQTLQTNDRGEQPTVPNKISRAVINPPSFMLCKL